MEAAALQLHAGLSIRVSKLPSTKKKKKAADTKATPKRRGRKPKNTNVSYNEDYNSADEDEDSKPKVKVARIKKTPGRKLKGSVVSEDVDYVPVEDIGSDASDGEPLPPPKKAAKRGRPRKGDAKNSADANKNSARKGKKVKILGSDGVLKIEGGEEEDEDKEKTDEDAFGGEDLKENNDDDGDKTETEDDKKTSRGCRKKGGGVKKRGERTEEEKEKATKEYKERKTGSFPCDICGRVFKFNYMRKRHQYLHSEEHGKNWQYKCEECKMYVQLIFLLF